MKEISQPIQVLKGPLDIREEIHRNPMGEEAVDLCDLTEIVRQYMQWIKLFPRIVPYYAVNANASSNVLRVLGAIGAGFDCASQQEINSVLRVGVSGSRIIFANPAKKASHIEFAHANGVNLMTFDSAPELEKIKAIAPNTKLVLRIQFNGKASNVHQADKFGCDPKLEAPTLLSLAKDLGLEVIGVSFHLGTGCLDSMSYTKAIQRCRKLFDLAKQLGIHFTLFDLGGGFPNEKANSLIQFAEAINTALDTNFPGNNVNIIAEPGRYLVSSCSTLITRIQSKREIFENDVVKKIMYFINDGIFGSLANVFFHGQQLIPQIMHLQTTEEPLINSSIWGQSCDSSDKLVDNVMMPAMEIDDLIAFGETGAYSKALMTAFNGFTNAKSRYFIERSVLIEIDCSELEEFCMHYVE